MDTRTILLAEDNDDEFVLMDMAFRKLGAQQSYRRVKNGEDVIRYLNGEGQYADRERYPAPSLLLLDLNMPVKGGFEVLDWIRKKSVCKHLVVTVLTGSSQEDDVTRAYEGLANSYLVKPTTIESLVRMTRVATRYWLEFNVSSRLQKEVESIGSEGAMI